MAESHGRTEPLLDQDVANGCWKLNVKEFHLPSQNFADHPKKNSFSFNGLLRKPKKQRKVVEYCKKQERLLEGFNEMEAMHETGFYPGGVTEDEMKKLAKSEKMVVHVSNICNLVLFAAKAFSSIQSRSLVVIASTLDSLLDLLSSSILWFTSNSMRKPNRFHYPFGKKRIQLVGIIVYASVMATLGLQILIESGPDSDKE